MHYKKLVTHAESDASTVSLLESGEQRYIKAINNNNMIPFLFMLQIDAWFVGPVLSLASLKISACWSPVYRNLTFVTTVCVCVCVWPALEHTALSFRTSPVLLTLFWLFEQFEISLLPLCVWPVLERPASMLHQYCSLHFDRLNSLKSAGCIYRYLSSWAHKHKLKSK